MVAIVLTTALALAFSSASAAPLTKRIAQVIPEATADWEQACLAAGGGQRCNPVSIQAFSTLLAAPGPCAQQDAADAMIDLARELNNDAEMIRLTQLFRQQPRNAPDSLSVLYCQQAPRNTELDGLFQCQFEGVNDEVFTGGVALGQEGTVPFGLSSLSPPGSCPANPGGKIPDGVQLNTLVQNPGNGVPVGGGGGDDSDNESPVDDTPPEDDNTNNTAPDDNNNNNNNNNGNNDNNDNNAAPGGFALQNGLDAQELNAQFQNMSPNDSCDAGDQACIDGGFAQCVNGSWVVTQCAGGLQCFALPLVNSPGTSITCDTEADAADRIARTGAQGGITGN